MTQEIDDRPEWERRYDRIDATLDRIAEQQDRNTKELAETRKLIGDPASWLSGGVAVGCLDAPGNSAWPDSRHAALTSSILRKTGE